LFDQSGVEGRVEIVNRIDDADTAVDDGEHGEHRGRCHLAACRTPGALIVRIFGPTGNIASGSVASG